jgi:hypothetical protein
MYGRIDSSLNEAGRKPLKNISPPSSRSPIALGITIWKVSIDGSKAAGICSC